MQCRDLLLSDAVLRGDGAFVLEDMGVQEVVDEAVDVVVVVVEGHGLLVVWSHRQETKVRNISMASCTWTEINTCAEAYNVHTV